MSGQQQLAAGWRCVKSEDFGQTFIYEPALPANAPTPGALATPWGPSYPISMAEAISHESAARNRAIMEEAADSCHFESTFFMSQLSGNGYGKTTRDIPTTATSGPAAPPLGTLAAANSVSPPKVMLQAPAAAPTSPRLVHSGLMQALPSGHLQPITPGPGLAVMPAESGTMRLVSTAPGTLLGSRAVAAQPAGLVQGRQPVGLSQPVALVQSGAHSGVASHKSFGLVSPVPVGAPTPQPTMVDVSSHQQQLHLLQRQLAALQSRGGSPQYAQHHHTAASRSF